MTCGWRVAAWIYWPIAFFASVLYGWNAVDIFKTHIAARDESLPKLPKPWWWHQRWLNFVGSVVGWLALWLLLRKFFCCVFGDCVANIGALHVVGALVAFVGITGYLPGTVVSLVAGVATLAGRLAEILVAWIASKASASNADHPPSSGPPVQPP